MERIDESVRRLLIDDDNLSCPGNCRYAAFIISKHVLEKYPNSDIRILVYPEAGTGESIHYSLYIEDDGGEKIIINTVKAPGFPLYIGSRDQAPGLLGLMKQTTAVI
jgi:hypothetical protein